LRETVVNKIPLVEGGQSVFLHASRIDNVHSTLHDVLIVDPGDPLRYRTTSADSAIMTFNEARTDLYLTLFQGVVYESRQDPPGTFNQIYFETQIIPLRGIGNDMERRVTSDRSDREMTIAMLASVVRERNAVADSLREENLRRSLNAVRFALGHEVDDPDVFGARIDGPGVAQPVGFASVALSASFQAPQTYELQPDHVTRRVSTATRASQTQVLSARLNAARFQVEIHKKYSLAVACLVFVLIGAPIGVRFSSGGLGMVIAVSSSIFAVYWVGLIGGESLADRGVAAPALGIWFPNVVFGILGLLLARGMGREGSGRGSAWDEVLFSVRDRMGGGFRRLARLGGRGS
jgi:lipopolysaccharide export system permease protein